jgi:hypothetical protein
MSSSDSYVLIPAASILLLPLASRAHASLPYFVCGLTNTLSNFTCVCSHTPRHYFTKFSVNYCFYASEVCIVGRLTLSMTNLSSGRHYFVIDPIFYGIMNYALRNLQLNQNVESWKETFSFTDNATQAYQRQEKTTF